MNENNVQVEWLTSTNVTSKLKAEKKLIRFETQPQFRKKKKIHFDERHDLLPHQCSMPSLICSMNNTEILTK